VEAVFILLAAFSLQSDKNAAFIFRWTCIFTFVSNPLEIKLPFFSLLCKRSRPTSLPWLLLRCYLFSGHKSKSPQRLGFSSSEIRGIPLSCLFRPDSGCDAGDLVFNLRFLPPWKFHYLSDFFKCWGYFFVFHLSLPPFQVRARSLFHLAITIGALGQPK